VAPAAHCTAQRAQYPKDHAQDDQDATDYPKDGAVENKREDDQDDAKGDQRIPPMLGVFVSIDSIRRRPTTSTFSCDIARAVSLDGVLLSMRSG
jgi:hypothetical protein